MVRTFATKLKASTTDSTRAPAGKRLGLKKNHGQYVMKNDILLRQRGPKVYAGENTHMGKDHTIHASKEGKVVITDDPWRKLISKLIPSFINL